jgi:hypothetical protein
LGRRIVLEINSQRDFRTPKARLGGAAASDEALLQVSVVTELAKQGAEPDAHGYSQWTWTMNIDATLTAPDGSIIWQQANREYQSKGWFRLSDGDDSWRTSLVRDRICYDISHSFVKQMLSGTH